MSKIQIGDTGIAHIKKIYSKSVIVSLSTTLSNASEREEDGIKCFLRNIYIDNPEDLYLLKNLMKKNMTFVVFKVRKCPIIELYYDEARTMSLSDRFLEKRKKNEFYKLYLPPPVNTFSLNTIERDKKR